MPVALAVALGGARRRPALRGCDDSPRRVVSVFPWDVFAVNTSGCLLVGVLVSALVDRHQTPESLRVGLVLGFVGAYTTFSTFAQDLHDLGQARHAAVLALNLAASVGGGVLAASCGTWLGRLL
jgi:fluoride exporter